MVTPYFCCQLQQAFRSEEADKSEIRSRSILAQMMPEAMVAYLENHGPEKFAQIFLGEYDTPEAIWNSQMRQFMIQKIAYHLADFTPRLKSNVRALYQVFIQCISLDRNSSGSSRFTSSEFYGFSTRITSISANLDSIYFDHNTRKIYPQTVYIGLNVSLL
jgi:hypothetical protein